MTEPRYIRGLRDWMGLDADVRYSKSARYITPPDAWSVLEYVDALKERIAALEDANEKRLAKPFIQLVECEACGAHREEMITTR